MENTKNTSSDQDSLDSDKILNDRILSVLRLLDHGARCHTSDSVLINAAAIRHQTAAVARAIETLGAQIAAALKTTKDSPRNKTPAEGRQPRALPNNARKAAPASAAHGDR
jgi:hypothetical protein